ncbi:hypothetical protein GEMRC1_006870 [Eukaryota sp. GEM-RC1]
MDKLNGSSDCTLFEHEVYEVLEEFGFQLPQYFFINSSNISLVADKMGDKKWVAKAVLEGVVHKTDIGAISFNITALSGEETFSKLKTMFENDYLFHGVLFVEMVKFSSGFGSELLISGYHDPAFGPCVAFGFGGTIVEYTKEIMKPNKSQLIFPADMDISLFKESLLSLPVSQSLHGQVRGIDGQLEEGIIFKTMQVIQKIMNEYGPNSGKPCWIRELEINPAVVSDGQIIALDGVMVVEKSLPAKSNSAPLHKISSLLTPNSAIVAGASGKNKLNPCSVILKQLMNAGVKSENLYCLHPKENEIQGVAAFGSLQSIMEARNNKPVDLIVVGVPAVSAGELVQQCLELYPAHAILVISAGFAETEKGKELSDRLSKMIVDLNDCPERRPVLNGPNTVGCTTIHNDVEYSTVFVPKQKTSASGKGANNIALICQSGGLMISRLSNMTDKLYPKYAITVGNQMDLSVVDFLEYLLEKEGVDVYVLYIEGLNDGDGIRLLKLIQLAKEKGKFVIVYKAGRSQQGQDAAQGHTASMAGDYQMFKNLVKISGGIICETLAELERVALLTTYWSIGGKIQKLIAKKKSSYSVGALSNAGFEKCAIADHLFSESLPNIKLCSWTDESKTAIEAAFANNRLSEVIDVGEVVDVTPMLNDKGTEDVVRGMYLDPKLDVCLFSTVPETLALKTLPEEDYLSEGALLSRLASINNDYPDKLMVLSIDSGRRYEPFRQAALDKGLPCFEYSDEAARCIELVLGSI